ncbi:flagellar basal body-associated FliL family protein [Actinotalea solisilvae]|uniref:flagellar basal body-associated FliL family protein n=1 Tax=Actinotalea solisilvae TaxID=2072922 RepID=UPI0018F1DEA7|nr:flagellar basal body-associated FliL family protein [Actinotalea solisilvae]
MTTQQRVIANKQKIPGRAEPAATLGKAATTPARRTRKRLVLLTLVFAALGGGAGYWFLTGPGASNDVAIAENVPEPGVVQVLEPISLNLAEGRYLLVGLGLQLTAEVEEEIEPSKALDIAIAVLSGRTLEEVSNAEGRAALKSQLVSLISEAYGGEVMDVVFTNFVTQ